MQKRLMRSQSDTMLAGVCGGLAEYFLIDPVIVRLIFVLITITTGLGLLFYPILWLIMPKAAASSMAGSLPPYSESWQNQNAQQVESEQYTSQRSRMYANTNSSSNTYASSYTPSQGGVPGYTDASDTSFVDERRIDTVPRSSRRRKAGWGGFILIGIGLMMLSEYFHISIEFVVPLIFIIVGSLLTFRRR